MPNETQIKTEILFKGLATLVLPLLAYAFSLASNISRMEERVARNEKDILVLVSQLEDTKEGIASAKTNLAEIKVTLQFIRQTLEN